ncbi:MAG: DUF192 domain-containing protein [Actinomycetota bacterium]
MAAIFMFACGIDRPQSPIGAVTTATTTAVPAATGDTGASVGTATTTAVSPIAHGGDLDGWEVATITLGTERMAVAVADDDDERSRGLIGVDDLGDLDGMLFVWADEVLTGFWMKDTLIPLDLRFFSSEGALVDATSMEPCLADPCLVFVAADPFRWALETPRGRLGVADPALVLRVDLG